MEKYSFKRAFDILTRIQRAIDSPNATVNELILIMDSEPIPDYMLIGEDKVWINVANQSDPGMDIISFLDYLLRRIDHQFYELENILFAEYINKGDTLDYSESLSRFMKIVEILFQRISDVEGLNHKVNLAIKSGLSNLTNTASELGIAPSNSDPSTKRKIQWNVGPGAIALFFKELLAAETTGGERIFRYDQVKQDVVRMICDNFIDKNGKPFVARSIESQLNGNGEKPDPKRDIIRVDFSRRVENADSN